MNKTTAITAKVRADLAHPLPLDQRPAAVYLAGLNTPASRRTMRQALDTLAYLLSDGQGLALALSWFLL